MTLLRSREEVVCLEIGLPNFAAILSFACDQWARLDRFRATHLDFDAGPGSIPPDTIPLQHCSRIGSARVQSPSPPGSGFFSAARMRRSNSPSGMMGIAMSAIS